jgi:hypothetical protein
MENFAIEDLPASPSPPSVSDLDSPGLLFSTTSLTEMVNGLDRYYAMLKALMVTPGVIHYDELVLLRRRAAQANLATAPFGRFQAQLRLAVELMRMGRRSEGFKLLSQIEEKLPFLSESEEVQSTAIIYGLWLSLVWAAAGNLDVALEFVQRLVVIAPDPAVGANLITFFRGIKQHAS